MTNPCMVSPNTVDTFKIKQTRDKTKVYTIRPNANYDCNSTPVPNRGAGTHYQNVDEYFCNGDSDYLNLKNDNIQHDDSFDCTELSLPSDSYIDHIDLIGYFKLDSEVSDSSNYIRFWFDMIFNGGFHSTEDSPNFLNMLNANVGVYTKISCRFDTSFATGHKWKVGEINGDYDYGGGIFLTDIFYGITCKLNSGNTIHFSQFYIDVYVGHDVIDEIELPIPETIMIQQSIDTNFLNFQSGNSKDYALQRNKKTLKITGIMWDGCTDGVTTCTELIQKIREYSKYLSPVILEDFKYSEYDSIEFNIINFNANQVQQQPNMYEWELDLEFVE